MLPPDGQQGFGICVQLLQRVRDVYQCYHRKNHALVALGEVGQKFLCLGAELLQLVGNGGGKVVPVVLALLPAGDVALNA